MKRTLSLFSLIALFAMILAACGAGGGAAQPTTAPAAPAEATAAPAADATEAPAAEATEAPAEPAADPAAPTEEPPEVLGSGDTRIVVWHGWQGEYFEAIEAAFATYAQENGVQIELLRVADLNNKVLTAVPSGQGPDIIAWVNDQIGKNALAEIIQPVDQYGIDEAYLRENFTDVAADAMIYDGQVYGVPESMEALTFIYNRALIDEADIPADTDALIARSQEYNAEDKYLFVYNGRNDAYFSAPWWQGAGVELVTPEGTTTINSPEGVAAGELIQQFSTIMPSGIDYGIADTLFKEGKAAMILNGPWSIASYIEAGIDVGLATIPVVSSSGQPGTPFVGVKLLMLANNAKQPEAAAALMQYYGSPEVQATLAEINKQVPANTEAQEQVADDPIIAGFIAQAENGRPLPNTEFIDAMWDPIAQTVEAIWTGSADPQTAVEDGAALFEEKVIDLR
ncbi:MAG TPA: extracellular solute-binding protein [Chloroflexaceae bacterium]|nr:extracellular solute-binding protein [Chloroflexaceae bacterium]